MQKTQIKIQIKTKIKNVLPFERNNFPFDSKGLTLDILKQRSPLLRELFFIEKQKGRKSQNDYILHFQTPGTGTELS